MSQKKKSINTPELSTVKSLNDPNTTSLYLPAQQTTDDAVVKVSITQLGTDISSKIDHQGTYNRGDLDAHPQYTLTSSFNQFQNQVNDDIQDLQDDIVSVVATLNDVSSSYVASSGSFSTRITDLETASSSLDTTFLRLDGGNSPSTEINWADNNITNIKGLYCENYEFVFQSFESIFMQSTANFVEIRSGGGSTLISSSQDTNFTAGNHVVLSAQNQESVRVRSDGMVVSNSIILSNDNPKINIGENDGTNYFGWDGSSWFWFADGSDFLYMNDQDINVSPPTTFGDLVQMNAMQVGAPFRFDASNYGYPEARLYVSSSTTGKLPKMLGSSDFTGLNTSVKWTSLKYENGIELTEHGTSGFNVPSSTSYRTRQAYGNYWTSTTAGTSAGAYAVSDMVYMGNSWIWHARVVPNQTNTSLQRAFFGLYGTKTSIGNVQPSSLTNILGFAYDSTDSLIYFMYNDAAGSATKLSTGFSCRDTNMMLDLYITCNGNGTVKAHVQRLDASGDYLGSNITTNIPSSTTFLNPQVWVNNTTTAASAYIGVQKIVLETI